MRLALILLTAAAASAQGDWAMLAPAAGVAAPVGGGFGGEWTAAPGVAAHLEAPAYGGAVRAALWTARYDALEGATGVLGPVPDFALAVPTVGWGPVLEAGPVRAGVGVHLGVAVFRFDDGADDALTTETEVAVGGWAGLTLEVAGPLEAWAEVSATRVALDEPDAVWTASGGLAVRLSTPQWLRRALR